MPPPPGRFNPGTPATRRATKPAEPKPAPPEVKEPKPAEPKPAPPEVKEPAAKLAGADVFAANGTLTLHGQTFAARAVISLVDAAPKEAKIDLWKLLTDLAALRDALMLHDWPAAGEYLAAVLADLGIDVGESQRAAIAEQLRCAAEAGGEVDTAAALAGEVGAQGDGE